MQSSDYSILGLLILVLKSLTLKVKLNDLEGTSFFGYSLGILVCKWNGCILKFEFPFVGWFWKIIFYEQDSSSSPYYSNT